MEIFTVNLGRQKFTYIRKLEKINQPKKSTPTSQNKDLQKYAMLNFLLYSHDIDHVLELRIRCLIFLQSKYLSFYHVCMQERWAKL